MRVGQVGEDTRAEVGEDVRVRVGVGPMEFQLKGMTSVSLSITLVDCDHVVKVDTRQDRSACWLPSRGNSDSVES